MENASTNLFQITEKRKRSYSPGIPDDAYEQKNLIALGDLDSYSPEQWLKYFKIFTDPQNLDRNGIKKLRIAIIKQTLSLFRKQKWDYLASDSNFLIEIDRNSCISRVKETKIINCAKNLSQFNSQQPKDSKQEKSKMEESHTNHNPDNERHQDQDINNNTEVNNQKNDADIFLIKGDCVEAAFKIKEIYPNYRVGMLDMANAHTPGGGYLSGAGAQEENLHRRSNLHLYLDDPDKLCGKFINQQYPIPKYGGILCRDVLFFRSSEQTGYALLSRPKTIDVIAVAAVAHPETFQNSQDQQYYMQQSDAEIMEKKIISMFLMALEAKIDALVLSSFGCG